MRARLLKAGRGRPPGAAAIIVGAHPDRFSEALEHPGSDAGFTDFEVLVTPEQIEDWIRRHEPGAE